MSELGYGLNLLLDNPTPHPAVERLYNAREIVVVKGAAPAGAIQTWTLREYSIYLRTRGAADAIPAGETVLVTPVLSARRGRADDPIGVDSRVTRPASGAGLESLILPHRPSTGTDTPSRPPAVTPPTPSSKAPPIGSALDLMGFNLVRQSLALTPGQPRSVHVAILDVSFERWRDLADAFQTSKWATIPTERFVGLSWSAPTPTANSLGHATLLGCACLMAAAPPDDSTRTAVTLQGYRLSDADGSWLSVDPWLVATNLALTLAVASESGADVALVPFADSDVGTPALLEWVLSVVTRPAGGRAGMTVVCSVGAPTDNNRNLGDVSGTALQADQLAAMPWVIGVGACDRRGRWLRRGLVDNESVAQSSHGPSVSLVAVGSKFNVPAPFDSTVDDSSLAASFVAAAAALARLRNPSLTAGDLRRLLCRTAFRPLVVDDRCSVSDPFNRFDRMGVNLKLGAGVLDAAASSLGASDPVCLALVLANDAGYTAASIRSMPQSDGTYLATLVYQWLAAAKPTALLNAYLAVRGALVVLALRSPAVLDELLWIGRHVSALWRDNESWAQWAGQDHGALVRRLRVLLAVVAEHAPTTVPEAAAGVAAWASALDGALAADRGGAACERVIVDALNHEHRVLPTYPEDD